MTIFKDNAKAYTDKLFSVIPGKLGKKLPAIKGWTEYSERMPTEEELRQWSEIPNTNLDLMLGKISGVIALDLDCEDDELVEKFIHLLPESPVEKVGSKGWTRFYRYTGEHTHVVKHDGQVVLELLSTGKKTTIPPSLHPNGNPYTWTGKSLLEVSRDDLPVLGPYLFSTIETILASSGNTPNISRKVYTGRNDELTSYCANLISNRASIGEAINKLIEKDKEINDSPLFEDTTEFKINSPYVNALSFYTSQLKSINVRRQRRGQELEIPAKEEPKLAVVETVPEPVPVSNAPVIKPATGLIGQIQNYILDRSFIKQPELALSAAITCVSTAISRKVESCGTAPNLYCLNVSVSGSGKDAPQQAIKDLYIKIGREDLLGAGDYVSDASLTDDLLNHPVRLDIIDECGGLLKAINTGTRGFDARMSDVLCELYSCSASKYLGRMTASEGRKGEVLRPGVNILGSTTPKAFNEAISRASIDKGLLGRFLLFTGIEGLRATRIKNITKPNVSILKHLRAWTNFFRYEDEKDLRDVWAGNPIELPVEASADKLLDDLFNKYDEMRASRPTDDVYIPIIARLYQQLFKIAMVDACGNSDTPRKTVITKQNVEWAASVIDYYFASIMDYVENNIYDSKHEEDYGKILKTIKNSKGSIIPVPKFIQKTKSIKKNIRQQLIDDMIASKVIDVVIDSETKENCYIYRGGQNGRH